MKKAVIYARYSSDSQSEQSIEGQLRVCKEFAERNEYLIVDEYIDRAMTGTNDKRPAFRQMIYDSKKKNFQFVIVYKLDRFSRNRYDNAINRASLEKNGVTLISATEPISNSPEGVILDSVLVGMAEYYSLELSQKVRRGQKESRIKGQFTGGKPPYGYDVRDLKVYVNESQARIVKYVFDEYMSGKQIKTIIADLKEQGIKNNSGNFFNMNAISRMLRNENYKGCVYADETIYTNIFPPIIDSEIFDEVNSRLVVAKRTSAHFKTDANYILSSKLYCGKCGSLMTGDSGKGKLGKIYHYYKCFNKKRNKDNCDKKSIGKDEIEEIVFDATKKFTQKVDLHKLAIKLTELYNNDVKKDSILESLKNDLNNNKKKLANILRALEDGIYNSTTNQRMKELEDNIKDLNEKIASREMLTIKTLSVEEVYTFLNSFKNIDYKLINARQRLIDMFVNRVILYDDHLEIYFNISDDKETQYGTKKEQLSLTGSDCSLMAEAVGFEPTRQFPDLTP